MPFDPTSRADLLISGSYAFPLGNNNFPLIVNYDQRLKYREGDYFYDLPKPIDTFYDKPFYGKVDRFQNVIIPKSDTSLIKQTSDNSNVFAFNFVSDAFFKLKRNLKIAGDSGGIGTTNTKFYQIDAVNGWRNWQQGYRRIIRNVFSVYNAYLSSLDKRDFNKIRTVKDYADNLLDYLKRGTYKLPITLTEFVLSIATPYTISGIVIELSNDSYSDDLNKFTNYFLDENFAYYVRAARKFGFYVDKNGPWRLFADVLSKPMLEDLANYNTNEQNFFDNYYDRTYTLDIDLFKQELVIAYNNFARENFTITESSIPTISCPTTKIKLLGLREQITIQDVNNFGDPYWLSFYFNLRQLESGIKYQNAKSLIEQSIAAARAYGYEKGLVYINNLFKPYLYDERLFNTNFLTSAPDVVRVGSVEDAPVSVVGTGGTSY
jgi:hypothetical protein